MFILMLGFLVASDAYQHGSHRRTIHHQGVADVNNKYPYVVSIRFYNFRSCTGTLIAHNWVLTAAHCDVWTAIRYGNMTAPSGAMSGNITKMLRHSRYRRIEFEEKFSFIYNDIALMQVDSVVGLNTFGNLSAIEYTSLTGLTVQYAGFGQTCHSGVENWDIQNKLNQTRLLQLGEGVVTSCNYFKEGGPFVCVSPICREQEQDLTLADSGGPLIYNGKVVGVLQEGFRPPVSTFTPVSPYLEWIRDVISELQD